MSEQNINNNLIQSSNTDLGQNPTIESKGNLNNMNLNNNQINPNMFQQMNYMNVNQLGMPNTVQYNPQPNIQNFSMNEIPQIVNDSSNSYQRTTKNVTPMVIKLFFKEEESKLPVASVIITFNHCGSSYDHLFQQQKQISPEGSRVAVYQVDLSFLPKFNQFYLKGIEDNIDEITLKNLKDMKADTGHIEKDCILFNFECCSKFSNSVSSDKLNPTYNSSYGFGEIRVDMFSLLQHLIEKGYFIMFGDFSLKALINDWNSDVLGANPLVYIGGCTGKMVIEFDSKTLLNSNSAQLKAVGELSTDGKLDLSAASDTIIVGVNPNNIDKNGIYKFEVLSKVISYASSTIKFNEYLLDRTKSLGHASFSYKSGSIMFVSAGHWIELKKMKADIDVMENWAKVNYGESNEEYKKIKRCQEKKNKNDISYKGECEYLASNMIQQVNNCNYSKNVMNLNKFDKK